MLAYRYFDVLATSYYDLSFVCYNTVICYWDKISFTEITQQLRQCESYIMKYFNCRKK